MTLTVASGSSTKISFFLPTWLNLALNQNGGIWWLSIHSVVEPFMLNSTDTLEPRVRVSHGTPKINRDTIQFESLTRIAD